MKRYTDEEILQYARSHVHKIDQQKGKRTILWVMTGACVVGIASLANVYFEKCKKTGVNLFEDSNFLAGFGFGVFTVVYVGILVLGLLRMFYAFHGKEIAVYRLLVKRTNETKI